jgi:hypothetical protein
MTRTIRVSAVLLTLALSLAPAFGAPTDKTSSATGSVTKVIAAERTIYVTAADGSELRFVWTDDTKINGTLTPGARVTVRYTTLPDGQNLAQQISVSRN